jgi:penicillin-binding protein 1A
MNKVTGGSLPAAAWRSFMLAATKGMPVKPLPSAPLPNAALPIPGSSPGIPAVAEEAPLDRLFGWLSAPAQPGPGPLPVDAGRYPGPAPGN